MQAIPRILALFGLAVVASGCAGLVSSVTEDLSRAILAHDDPATVESGAPAYLLMVDGFIQGDPDDEDILRSGASLYAAYAGIFVEEETRSRKLAQRSFDYARRSACEYDDLLCNPKQQDFQSWKKALAEFDDEDDLPYLNTLAQSWLVWIRANSSDWAAIGDLPRVEAILDTVLSVDDTFDNGGPHVYLGILKTLRPPALGGQPEKGREHFERALDISGGNNLGAKVAMAEHYARITYDRELHDRLLEEVVAADPDAGAGNFTLMNVMAQRRAKDLLVSADDYF
ncbi:MAG: TRAP transporter TatT component family protein [Gammaproteobacteria bacterium]|nr:TRAP transporter TatT component family protein [Gammaproteobacteria bacterium]